MMRIALLLAFLLQFSISYSQVTISIANVTGNSGGTVDVEFRATNFTNVFGMQFSVRFDPAVITYNQVLNLNNAMPGFDATGSFGTSSVADGALRVQWNPPGLEGVTLPANSLLFTIRFNVIGGQGTSSEVYISGTPLVIEFFDPDFNPIELDQNRGSVTVVGGGTGTVRLIASNETSSTGSIVCVKFSAEGFTNVGSMQFSIGWNPSFMTFNGIGSNNNNLNIGTGILNINNANGTIALSYSPVDPVTLSNGTILFELCFLVTGTSGSTSVSFSNTPTSIEVGDPDGNAYNTLTQNGSVTLGGVAPDCEPEGFTFAIEHLTVQPGQLFCLKVRVFDFVDIAGLGMTFQWDPTELRYLETREWFNGIGLGAGNFGNTMADMGFLGMVWDSPSGAATVPEGGVLFEICFEALGSAGVEAMININSSKIGIEVLLEDGSETELFECKGVVTISDEVPFTVSLTATTNPSCSNSTNGSISSTIMGGTPNFTYAWSPASATGPNPSMLGPGNYTVTVTDSGGQTAVSSITLSAINTIIVTPTIVPANCGTSTGSITLSIGGNAGTPTYAWSNGAPNTNTRLNVAAGTYMVTITYGTGCTFTQSYTVPGTPAISVQGSVNNVAESVTITVTGGSGTYTTYLWSNGLMTQNISGVGPGSYTVTVTDSNGCTGTGGPFVIGGDQCVDFNISNYNGFGVSCNGVCDGSVVPIPVFGTGPYTYRWSNGSTSDSLTNICAGMYTVTVTDANGMTCTQVANVTAPARLMISIESFTKSSGSDGAATVEATGGVPGYTYTWNDENETVGASISGLPPERFIVTATDLNGCTATRPINFAEDSECYEALPAITPNGDGYNDALIITCLEGTTNRIDIFDRWGRPVFSASNYANDWQGTSQGGETLPDGGYFVVIRATESTGVERVERRSFSIIRTLR